MPLPLHSVMAVVPCTAIGGAPTRSQHGVAVLAGTAWAVLHEAWRSGGASGSEDLTPTQLSGSPSSPHGPNFHITHLSFPVGTLFAEIGVLSHLSSLNSSSSLDLHCSTPF